jgi:hypothetical protein
MPSLWEMDTKGPVMLCTWPPEKPTATTPMSPAFGRNFDGTIDVVIVAGSS